MHIFFICPLILYCRFIYDVFLGGFFLCVLKYFWVFLGKSMDLSPSTEFCKAQAINIGVMGNSGFWLAETLNLFRNQLSKWFCNYM